MALFTFTYKYTNKEGEEVEIEAQPMNSWSEACWTKEETEKAGATCSDIYPYQEESV